MAKGKKGEKTKQIHQVHTIKVNLEIGLMRERKCQRSGFAQGLERVLGAKSFFGK